MMNPLIHAVVFDFGNVLSLPQDQSRVAEMSTLSGLGERFRSAYDGERIEYDRGKIDAEAYWQSVLLRGGISHTEVSRLDGEFVRRMTELDIQSWTYIRTSMVTWAERLKEAGIKTAILSNMPRDHTLYIERTFDWLSAFDVRVYSYAVGSVKPERAIYEECLSLLEVAAGETLFVDDIERNANGARSVGIHAVLFHDLPRLAVTLREYPGLPLPPAYPEM